VPFGGGTRRPPGVEILAGTADNPASSALTRPRLGWEPIHPRLIADLDDGHYFA
jgi:hypothetical protein